MSITTSSPSPLPLLPLPSSLPSLAPLPSCPRRCRLLLGGDSCPVLTTVSSAEEEGGDQAVTGRVFGPCPQYVSPPCQSWHTHDGRIFAIRISPMVANLEQPTHLPLGPMKLKTPTVRHSLLDAPQSGPCRLTQLRIGNQPLPSTDRRTGGATSYGGNTSSYADRGMFGSSSWHLPLACTPLTRHRLLVDPRKPSSVSADEASLHRSPRKPRLRCDPRICRRFL